MRLGWPTKRRVHVGLPIAKESSASANASATRATARRRIYTAHGLPERGKAVKVSIAEQSVGGRQKDKKSKWRHMDRYSQRDHDASWQE